MSQSRYQLFSISLGLFILGFVQPVQAQRIQQVPVLGGNGNLFNTRFMSPNTGVIFNRSTDQPTGTTDRQGIFYRNNDIKSFMLRTQMGNTPMNAKFDTTLNPTIANAVNRPPVVGDRFQIDGTLTFRIPRMEGGMGVSLNRVPATLDVALTGVTGFNNPTPIREYLARDFVFTEVGVVESSSTTVAVQRDTPVDVPQYVTSGGPQTITVAGTKVRAREFTEYRDGLSATGDVKFDVTGGTVGTTNTMVFENGPTPPPTTPPIVNAPIFIDPVIRIPGLVLAPPAPVPVPVPDDRHWTTGGRGDHVIQVTDRRVEHPTLGQDIGVGFDTGYTRDGRDTRCNCQGEVVWVDHKDNTVYVPIGIPSRVFPGMTGMERRKAVGAASRNGNRPEPSQKLTPR
jgi:hypothetical protein